jgi:thiamine transporter ThiT
MTSLQVRKLTYAALFLAIALVLPFITGQIPEIGKSLSPMHIPVLLCGFLCGWPWGLAAGFIAPLLRSVIFGMPAMFPGAVAMAFELATYGCLSGLLYKRLKRTKANIYITLILSMIAGRIVWGIARLILAGLSGTAFTWALFLSGAITTAIPGIILHIALIPILVMVLERAGLSLNK